MALPSVDFLNPLPLCLFVLIFKLVEIPSSLSYAPINKKGVRCKDAEMRDIRWNNIYYSTRRVEEILGAARSIVEDACISAPLRTAVKNILISYCFRDQTRKRYNRWKLCRKALALLGECSPLSAAADNGYIIKRREMKKVWSQSAERGGVLRLPHFPYHAFIIQGECVEIMKAGRKTRKNIFHSRLKSTGYHAILILY